MILDKLKGIFQKKTADNTEERIEQNRRRKKEQEAHEQFEQTYTDLNELLDSITEHKKHG